MIDFGLRKGVRDPLKDRADSCGRARHSCFTELIENFVGGPLSCSVERKGQTILRQVDGGGYGIVDRCESSFTEHVVIGDAEILEASIAVCAVRNSARSA
jgi:hypothetical protein